MSKTTNFEPDCPECEAMQSQTVPAGAITFCDTNDCEQATCHRCFPRADCDDHDKCREFIASGEAYSDADAKRLGVAETAPAFTPGQWEVEIGEDRCFHQGNRVAITVSGISEDGEPYNVTIAELWPADRNMDIKDGRLIAAAPALYEAAQQAINVLYDDDPATRKAIEMLRAALALVDAKN